MRCLKCSLTEILNYPFLSIVYFLVYTKVIIFINILVFIFDIHFIKLNYVENCKRTINYHNIFIYKLLTTKKNEIFHDLEIEKSNLDRDVKVYASTWKDIFEKRDVSLITTDKFDSEVTLITSTGNLIGIAAFQSYYNNYFTGFSDAKITILDVYSQGNLTTKHWRFTGTHDGEMFGIPATNKKMDLYGVSLVTMKYGKVLKEKNYFDNYSFLSQLGLIQL